MQKTKIEWCDYSWNPIKGICPMDCKTPHGKSYCYARKIYKRFDIMGVNTLKNQGDKIILDDKELQIFEHGFRRSDTGPRKPSKIFVCSTMEIFHSSIPPAWRNQIFKIIEREKRHIFIILTKLPENIDRPMPESVWLGISTENMENYGQRIGHLYAAQARVKFVSFEPLFGEITSLPAVDWIIFGRLTGHGKKYDPKPEWVKSVIDWTKGKPRKCAVFLKDNLIPILGEDYVKAHQEWPE